MQWASSTTIMESKFLAYNDFRDFMAFDESVIISGVMYKSFVCGVFLSRSFIMASLLVCVEFKKFASILFCFRLATWFCWKGKHKVIIKEVVMNEKVLFTINAVL